VVDPSSRLKAALEGRYRIERQLGEGGMATVYLAEDLRHDRKVAVKVLKPELAAVLGGERFISEIRTTANLQHPHILPLFDSGEADGFLFYVMPYVEGETLRERIDREKQLPVGEAIDIASKVAGALQAAHDRGVIHRDIKPANILLQNGEPLVADFGIALAVQEAGGRRLTETGLSVGTPYYMSPEQATADRDPDQRSDLYSLACVLYEMLAGDPPFTASTAQAVVAKILSGRPAPITEARPSVPAHVEATIARALQRLPADRFGRMSEFVDALAGRIDVAPLPGRSSGGSGGSVGAGRFVWPAVAAAALLLAAVGWMGRGAPAADGAPSHLAIPLPQLGGAATAGLRQLALSPDGGTLLFAGTSGSNNRTLRRDLADPRIRELASTMPFLGAYVFSPDGGEFVALNRARALFRYSSDGTNEQTVSDADVSPWMDWASDGSIWYSGDSGRGLFRVDASGSTEQLFSGRLRGHTLQQLLEDAGAALMVDAPRGVASGPLVSLDLESGETQTVIPGEVVAAAFTAGHLVTVLSNGVLQAARYDARRAEVTGPQVRLAEGVLVDQGIAQLAVSDNGVLAYIPEEPRALVFIGRDGASRPAALENRNFHAPSFSPDGSRISVDFSSTHGRNVWTLGVAEGVPSRATFVENGHDARWSPDGGHLTYIGDVRGDDRFGLFRSRPGDLRADSLLVSPRVSYTGEWLPDGSAIVSTGDGLEPNSGSDLVIVRNGGRGPVEPLLVTRFEEMWPAVSPDGRWLAYGSNRSGAFEIYVQSMDGEGPQVQVSLGGGTEPLWDRSSGELYYRAGAGAGDRLVAASIATDPRLAVASRQTLFPVADIATGIPHTNYDVSPDGQSFVMVRFNPSTRIMVIQDLPALVARLESGPR
jgi:tRNA A-37 threonylcarbamoyl transferase component Bud32